MKIAIVGSEEQYWKPEQRTKAVSLIKSLLQSDPTNILISGGCPKGGVDIWAEVIAEVIYITKDIKRPDVYQWEDVILSNVEYNTNSNLEYEGHEVKTKRLGYKSRNMQIAKECDILYCIDPKDRIGQTGGKWTMEYAKKIGKTTRLILL